MPSDNVTLSPGANGATVRTLADANGTEWSAGVVSYATSVSNGANVLQVVTPTNGLPVAVSNTVTVNGTVNTAQNGPWNVTNTSLVNTVASVTSVSTINTVNTVESIVNPLPAGTNLIGQVVGGIPVGAAFNGTVATTIKYVPITASNNGATTIVNAVANKTIILLRWSASANGNVNINWQSHTTTATATGLHYMTQFATAGGAYCPIGIFASNNGEALDINLSGAVAVGGEATVAIQ